MMVQVKIAFNIVNKYLSKLNIVLYRINIDINWNQGEANNLAFSKIKTEYVIRNDIDHIIDENNLIKLLELINTNLKLDTTFYGFKRKDIYTHNTLRSHPNIYIISKSNYMKVNGYNESLCGNYGDDFEFLPRMKKYINHVILEDIEILVFPDYGTKNLSRDTSINLKKMKDLNLQHLFLRNSEYYILEIESYI